MTMERKFQNILESRFKEIEVELTKLAADYQLTCEQARRAAAVLGVEPLIVGKAANRLGIKITDCQLGCFGPYKERS